jgi:hypothetical protein
MAFGGTCCWRCLATLRTLVETATAVVHGNRTKPLYELGKRAERHLANMT